MTSSGAVVVGLAPASAWESERAAWVRSLRAAGAPRTTVRLRDYQIRRLGLAVAPTGPWDVTEDHLTDWFGTTTWAPATLASFRAGVRAFYVWAVRTGRATSSPAAYLPPVRTPTPTPRPAPEIAYREALGRADDRVRLMLRLAAELGMRRGEVAVAHSADVERDLDGWTLLVHGKGGRNRRLPMPAGLAAMVRERPAGYLFPGAVDGHVSADWTGKLVGRALPGAWTMHTLRHRFGTVAHSYAGDLATSQDLLGHADPKTTRIYVAVSPAALRATVEAVARH